MTLLRFLFVLLALAMTPTGAGAAPALDGATLSWPWALPFAGILLTIATGPLLFAKLWHAHYGKFALAWSALTLLPLALIHGASAALSGFAHALIAEYVSFIVLLFVLYVVAGGILVTGSLRGTPLVNTCILALGTLMASVVGTTGAAMILIRPLLKANEHRAHNVHVVIFFIFLVANIGGALSPLGDPPLFVGFLRGVDFFWTTRTLWGTTALVAGLVLAVFALIDVRLLRKEPHLRDHPYRLTIRIHGWINFALLGLVIAMILVSAVWRPNVAIDVFGTPLELQNLVRDAVLVVIALVSLWLTPDEHREANGFSFEPIREVALIFAGIFTTLIPVLAMLQAGKGGAFAWLIAAVTHADGPNAMAYFWLTGVLSALLDNAPTYLVFFELAGGDPAVLMGRLAPILQAISMGAVYMGALTYIGNAPNFMIYAIASDRGVKMPSFFGYLLWSVAVLTPVFVILSLVTLAR